VKRKVMYCGERVGHFRVGQLFKDKRGKEYSYRGVKRVWPGCVYEISSDNKIDIRPKEISCDWEMSEQDRLEMEANKVAVTAYRLERRKAMELKRPHKDIVKAVELLRPFYRNLGHFDQARFVGYLRNQMSKGKRK
jgi:hypothetical protein